MTQKQPQRSQPGWAYVGIVFVVGLLLGALAHQITDNSTAAALIQAVSFSVVALTAVIALRRRK